MLDWTDRHYRFFARLITQRTLLYTEMVTTGALIHGDRERFLRFDPAEHPLALQLGGSDPEDMATCARMGADWGYDEININVGCPSDRVQSGRFGACLMAEPRTVADCFRAMQAAVEVPVTVKSRIGIDDQDSVEFLYRFVDELAAAGCTTFIVHARIAILDGLSPKENREVPPLVYERVFGMKRDYPELEVILNGGLKTVADVSEALHSVDGVMIGREAYHNPWILAELETELGQGRPPRSREAVVEAFLPYVERQLSAGVRLGSITRHILGLFAGQPGARRWRRVLSEEAHRDGAGVDVIERALQQRAAAA